MRFRTLSLPGWLAVGLFLLIALYSYWRLADLIKGPSLNSKLKTNTSLVTITGQASRIATLHFNDGQIFTDRAGTFSQTLLPLPGYNILKLDAKDKFGRTITNELTLYYSYGPQEGESR